MANIDNHQVDWPFPVAVTGFLLVIVGLLSSRWAQWSGVAKARVTPDLVWVRIGRPHRDFAAAATGGRVHS
jgi:hypothetical protein